MTESPSHPLELTIITVTHDSRDHIRDCLQSVQRASEGINHEVIVVDNASGDGTADIVRQEFPHVRLILSAKNLGLAHGINQGAAQSRGRYILLLNPDTLVMPETLGTLLAEIQQSPGTGLLGCRLIHGDRSLQQSFGYETNFLNGVIQKLFFNLWENYRFPPVGWVLQRLHSRKREVDWVKGACMMVCRQAFFDAELMDETFFLYLEDADLCLRIRQLGWKIRYTPEAEVMHFGGGSSRAKRGRCALEYRKSQLHYFSKHLGETYLNLLKVYLRFKMRKNLLGVNLRNWMGSSSQQLSEEKQLLLEVLSWIRKNP